MAATALLGSRLLVPKPVFANDGAARPRPIPGGTPFLQLFCGSTDPTIFHAYGPEAGAELSTITDFNGEVGATEVIGTGTGLDTRSGRTTRLFFDCDMRFMRGEFIRLDGREHEGTFGFLWLDLFTTPQFEVQTHDFNPGIAASGLFWTVPMRENAVQVDLEHGTATLRAHHFDIPDFHDFCNTLVGGPRVPGNVSFQLDWGGTTSPYSASDRTFVFRGLRTEAMIEWSARESGFEFHSDPGHTSTALFAAIGEESNGVFRNER